MGHAQEERDWWSQQIQTKTDRQEVLTGDFKKAEEAKKEFMTKEGIQEPKENQLTEPALTFQLYTQEAKDMIWEEDENEEAEETQKALLVVQKYAATKTEAKKANLVTGWNGANPEDEMSADELPELSDEEEDDDEETMMEEFKKASGDKPHTLEEWVKYRKEQKEKRDKEGGKTSKHTKVSGKTKKEKKNGKKNGPALASKKEQGATSDGK